MPSARGPEEATSVPDVSKADGITAAVREVAFHRASTIKAGRDWVADCNMPRQFFTDIGAANYVVRGRHYLQDRKKMPAVAPALGLTAVDMFKMKRHTRHIARQETWRGRGKQCNRATWSTKGCGELFASSYLEAGTQG